MSYNIMRLREDFDRIAPCLQVFGTTTSITTR